MIDRVVLAGVDVDLADVFASVTIRHGRGSADDGPLASTATLALVNVTRELAAAFRVADPLELYLADDEPRFVGRITDASLNDAALSIIAVSQLSWISRRKVGAGDWPAEAWSARVARVFAEGAPEVGYVLEVGDHDPQLAARIDTPEEPIYPLELGAYLAELAVAEPAAIADQPDGTTLVQALTARRGAVPLELDPELVAFAPEWSMIDDVANLVTVTYATGEITRTDEVSRDRFEDRPLSITTTLSTLAAATTRADDVLNRRGVPEWLVERAELLELELAIAIGSHVELSELPAWAPVASYEAIVEGWEDHVEAGDDGELEWTMVLTLSAPRLSGIGLRWTDLPADLLWSDAGAATWRHPELMVA